MWRASLNHAVKELRFVIKQGPEHHGVMRWCMEKMPEIRVLNQNAFFSFTEINEHFTETPSACHIIYGDGDMSTEQILTEGLSVEEFEKILKEKVAKGLTLERVVYRHNANRDIPIEVAEARKSVRWMDDGF